jgi:hypothetical protein
VTYQPSSLPYLVNPETCTRAITERRHLKDCYGIISRVCVWEDLDLLTKPKNCNGSKSESSISNTQGNLTNPVTLVRD